MFYIVFLLNNKFSYHKIMAIREVHLRVDFSSIGIQIASNENQFAFWMHNLLFDYLLYLFG